MLEQNDVLSERELEILRLVATGAANKEIARILVISPNTVKVHLRNIFAKIGVSTRTEATLYAIQIGLINPGVVQPGDSPAETAEVETDLPDQEPEGMQVSVPQQVGGSLDAAAPAQTPIGLPVEQTAVEERRRPIQPWQIGLIVAAALLLIGYGVVSARMMMMPTVQPTVTLSTSVDQQTMDRWVRHKDMPSPRKGMGITEYENSLYVIAGETSRGIDGTLLRYRLADNSWETLADKPTPVTHVQAVLLGEKIYVPGGRQANGQDTQTVEAYDPRQNQWEKLEPLPQPVSAYALVSFEGRLYLFGGKSGEQYLSTVYIYDPQQPQWKEGSALSTPRAFAGAVVVGGKIHILGGSDGQNALNLHQTYYPSRDVEGETAWENLAPLPEGRYAMGTAHLAGLIYLMGGYTDTGAEDNSSTRSLQYQTQTEQWMQIEGSAVSVGAYPALLAYGNYLYVLGGETSAGVSPINFTYQAIYTIAVPILQNDK